MLPRLMDQNQLQLAQALKEGSEQSGTWHSIRASLRDAFLACKGGIAFDASYEMAPTLPKKSTVNWNILESG